GRLRSEATGRASRLVPERDDSPSDKTWLRSEMARRVTRMTEGMCRDWTSYTTGRASRPVPVRDDTPSDKTGNRSEVAGRVTGLAQE
ncbi:hypothetical protein QLX08_011658, partial [Tetragonisca angustula]